MGPKTNSNSFHFFYQKVSKSEFGHHWSWIRKLQLPLLSASEIFVWRFVLEKRMFLEEKVKGIGACFFSEKSIVKIIHQYALKLAMFKNCRISIKLVSKKLISHAYLTFLIERLYLTWIILLTSAHFWKSRDHGIISILTNCQKSWQQKCIY